MLARHEIKHALGAVVFDQANAEKAAFSLWIPRTIQTVSLYVREWGVGRLIEIDRDAHPILAANLKLLSNQAFILRWQNGTDAPLGRSYTAFIDVIVTGIEAMAEPPPRSM